MRLTKKMGSGSGSFPWEQVSPKHQCVQSKAQLPAHLLKDLPHLLVEANRDPVDGPVQPSPAQPLTLLLTPADVMSARI